ncbi:MAG: peptidase MA family metallohydrolase [Candidatus Omnitrophota bacterium]|jgi:hypothetical protein
MKRIFLLFAPFLILTSAHAQGQEWKVSKSTHFIVYYKNSGEDFINKLTGYAEDYYNKIADNLGLTRFNFWLWDNRAKVYVYDDSRDYHVSTKQPQWASGSTHIIQKKIETYPGEEGFFETVLPHEMGHIVFREFVGFNNMAVPMWLDEGVAMYQERGRGLNANSYLRQAMREGNFMNIFELSTYNVESSTDNKKVEIYYIESLSMVVYLIKEFGREKFVLFCQNLRDKQNLERAVAASYNFSNLKELDSAWQEYIKK